MLIFHPGWPSVCGLGEQGDITKGKLCTHGAPANLASVPFMASCGYLCPLQPISPLVALCQSSTSPTRDPRCCCYIFRPWREKVCVGGTQTVSFYPLSRELDPSPWNTLEHCKFIRDRWLRLSCKLKSWGLWDC